MTPEKILRYVVLGGVFALPFIVFIVTRSLFFPFIVGKNFAFRLLVELVTAAWLGLALMNPAYRPKRSWLLAAFAIFVVIIAIADAQGAYPFKSFWSNYERMDGWVTLAHLFAYFVAAACVLNTEKLWKTLWQVSLTASVLVGLYGFLQLIGAAALGQGGVSGLETRLDATFGNPIYLAAYMLFNIFIAALLWSEERRGSSGWTPLTLFYAGTIILDTLVLFFTGTRGTMLGLVGGVFLAVLCYAISIGSGRMWRNVGIVVGAIVVIGGLLFVARDTALVKKVGFLQRLATISVSDSTVKARFLNWGMALEGVKERPLLGWGQENYAIVFDKYYDPRMYGQEQWFDRVHNIFFDWLVAGGILGLLGYLSLYACALWCLWRKAPWNASERAILTGLLAAYFFHDLFVFDNVTSYILFATVLAYILWKTTAAEQARPIPEGELVAKSAYPLALAAALLLFAASAWLINGASLQANRALLQAVAPHSEGVSKNLEYFKKAISYNVYGNQEAREQLVQGAAQLAGVQGVTDEVKKDFFQTAGIEMTKQMEASPLDARFPLFLGILLDSYGNYPDATPMLQRAHSLSPKKQTILYELGNNLLAQGKNDEALATFKEAFDALPENSDARFYYAAAAIRFNKDALADELLAPLIPTGEAADSRVAAAYVARGLYGKIAVIWAAHVKAVPQDVQGYFTLAAAYFGSGEQAKAIAVLEEAGRVIPSSKEQADALIADIKSGKAKVQ